MSVSSFGGLTPPLRPRRGKVLLVVGVARISTEHQDVKSLADQKALYREYLKRYYPGRFKLKMISSQGSGERLDRKEFKQLRRLIRKGKIDLVLAEDLGRIARRIQVIVVCEECQDAGVRLIAINDSVDTAKPDWRVHSFFASMRHESYNADTASRIRRSARSRFMEGGTLRTPLFCYDQPAGAKHDSQITKKPGMETIVEQMVRQLEEGRSFSEVADWLDESNVPLGPGSRVKKWTGVQVRNVIFNPLLKGERVRNRKVSVRHNQSGRRRSVPAPPDQLLKRRVPHLAFIEEKRYDRLIAKLTQRGERYSVPKRRNGDDPRANKPKKRTRCPGQQCFCKVCGRMFVFGGHGRTKHLMCSGARSYECWLGTTFESELAAKRIGQAVLEVVESLPDFDEELLAALRSEAEQAAAGNVERRRQLEQQVSKNRSETENVMTAIRNTGGNDLLYEEVRRLESERDQIGEALRELDDAPVAVLELPPIETIRAQIVREVRDLSSTSFEFGRLIRQLIPRIEIFPVRLCDGGNVELRGRFTISLAKFVPPSCRTASVRQHLTREVVLDFFEPPQRAALLTQIVELKKTNTERQTAAALGIFQPVVQRAMKLHRLMAKLGITDPYVEVTAPPADLTKMRRHLHKRYRFNPLPPADAA